MLMPTTLQRSIAPHLTPASLTEVSFLESEGRSWVADPAAKPGEVRLDPVRLRAHRGRNLVGYFRIVRIDRFDALNGEHLAVFHARIGAGKAHGIRVRSEVFELERLALPPDGLQRNHFALRPAHVVVQAVRE